MKRQKVVKNTGLELGETSGLETKFWPPSVADTVDYPTTISPFILTNCTSLLSTCRVVIFSAKGGP